MNFFCNSDATKTGTHYPPSFIEVGGSITTRSTENNTYFIQITLETTPLQFFFKKLKINLKFGSFSKQKGPA